MENNEPVGLAPRLLLSFGSAGEPGDYRLTEFSRCVALPFKEKVFSATVSLLGASRPFSSELPTSSWTVSNKQQYFS